MTLECGHRLHSDCLHHLLRGGYRADELTLSLCPICRAPVVSEQPSREELRDLAYTAHRRHGSPPPAPRPRRPRSSSDLARERLRAYAERLAADAVEIATELAALR